MSKIKASRLKDFVTVPHGWYCVIDYYPASQTPYGSWIYQYTPEGWKTPDGMILADDIVGPEDYIVGPFEREIIQTQ